MAKFTVKTVQGLADGKFPAIERQMQQDDDCRGLYLYIGPNSRSWVMRYTFNGKPMVKTVAKVAAMSLKEARKTVESHWVLVAKGIDPYGKAEPVAAPSIVTFAMDTEAFRQHRLTTGTGWTKGSDDGFCRTMKKHIFDHIGQQETASLKLADIKRALQPLYKSNYRTYEKAYCWVNAILDRAILTDDEDQPRFVRPNPCPKVWEDLGIKDVPVRSHPAIPWQEAPALYQRLATINRNSSKALRLMFRLGMPRPGEIIGLRWSEIAACGVTHYTPPERLKNGKKRRDDVGNMVGLDRPLLQGALDILATIGRTDSDFIFSGRPGKMIGGTTYGRKRERSGGKWVAFDGHMQSDAMQLLLKELGVKVTLRDGTVVDAHVHGLRATFSTWVEDNHREYKNACEINIDHLIFGKVEGAYKRTTLIAERKELLTRWAAFLTA